MPLIFATLAGIIFGAGLALSDMVNPARVLNFLDFAGSWDPTLMFVMAGGLAVTTLGYRLIFRRRAVRHRLGPRRHLPRPGVRRSRGAGPQGVAVRGRDAGRDGCGGRVARQGVCDEGCAGTRVV